MFFAKYNFGDFYLFIFKKLGEKSVVSDLHKDFWLWFLFLKFNRTYAVLLKYN